MPPRCLIIGGSRGIGLALVQESKRLGFETIATCRSHSEALAQEGIAVHEGVEVTDAAAVNTLIAELGPSKFDYIVHNAGIANWESNMRLVGELAESDLASMEIEWQVNGLAPIRMLDALLKSGNLAEGSTMGFLTSRMGSIADGSGKFLGYRGSKCWLNMAVRMSSMDLKPKGVHLALLHPGMVTTDMTEGFGKGITPAESAAGIFTRMTKDVTAETTGTFWHGVTGEVLPW